MIEQLQNEFTKKLNIWEREVEIEVVFDCFKNESITDIQKQAYADFLDNQNMILTIAKEKIINYVNHDIDIFPGHTIPSNVFKFVMPKAIYIKRDIDLHKLIGLLFNYRYREEDGICTVFKDNKFLEIGPENIIL